MHASFAPIGSQALKSGVTSVCEYTNCISGHPGNKLTVSSTGPSVSVMGASVAGYPGNISTSTSGAAWFATTTDINVSAHSASSNVMIDGPCFDSGFKNASCTIPAGTLLYDDFILVESW